MFFDSNIQIKKIYSLIFFQMSQNCAGERYLRIGSLYYRAWAAKSKNEGYLLCKWCDSEILIKNVAGKHGHEQSTMHQTNREKYESHPERKNGAVQKERQILPRVLENYQITKLFELRLLGFCAGNFTFQNRWKADYLFLYKREEHKPSHHGRYC
jgi:hypothetical protein